MRLPHNSLEARGILLMIYAALSPKGGVESLADMLPTIEAGVQEHQAVINQAANCAGETVHTIAKAAADVCSLRVVAVEVLVVH